MELIKNGYSDKLDELIYVLLNMDYILLIVIESLLNRVES